ncbi:uncharacterized protein KY384_004901 [Bacidia gigantensis]|uniref:uncharacterized protein n=1 Tax=Bacidia gigantensis TaxID=2732470 RepID=UPI001D048E1F|nr:uncharacterized protein KY384_004901 [Bacidia gigantensis]KAG8530399.1 hypothetical protein KY384_004901 [Bacidia gigantensis]
MAQAYQPPDPQDMISPFAMPPPQCETIPQGHSGQFAKSQILRRLSTKSNTSSNSSRRTSARIVKIGGVGNSPHNVQRRRTTAAHRMGDFTRSIHDNPYLTREHRLWNYHQARQTPEDVRPFSWHPGYEGSHYSQEPIHTNELAMGNTIAGLESLAVTNTPPSVEDSIHNAFTMGYGFPVGMATQQNTHQLGSHLDCRPAPCNITYPQPFSQDIRHGDCSTSQWHYPYNPTPYDNPTFAGPAVAPQQFSSGGSHVHHKAQPAQVEDEGEELVGIGLYDKGDVVSPIFNPAVPKVSQQIKVGKDLKLEETWQPPENVDDDDDSSVEGEEVDELQCIAPVAGEPQHTCFPSYGDLSNQTFFLDDNDDAYVNNDQYPDYLGLDYNSGLQAKPQPTESGNIFWF